VYVGETKDHKWLTLAQILAEQFSKVRNNLDSIQPNHL
jgi:hypothetical protein